MLCLTGKFFSFVLFMELLKQRLSYIIEVRSTQTLYKYVTDWYSFAFSFFFEVDNAKYGGVIFTKYFWQMKKEESLFFAIH